MPRKALIVEDDVDMGHVLAEYLRRWGFEPTTMTTGSGAANWTREQRPELILLDLMLPDVDGYAVAQELKLNGATNLVPLIMVTARSLPEERVRGLEVGADYYLTKPFSERQLRDAIDRVLEARAELQRHGTHGEVVFHLQSDTRYLEQMNLLLASLFLFSKLPHAQVRQLTTAVREMGANAIEWGHRNQIDRVVTVTYRIDAEKVTIVIRDNGPGFDPTNLPHAAQPEDPAAHFTVREAAGLREGGFGIMMARGLVDRLEYNATGNEVRLIKFFPALSPSQ